VVDEAHAFYTHLDGAAVRLEHVLEMGARGERFSAGRSYSDRFTTRSSRTPSIAQSSP